jgi:glyoxylase-like metal-dependent hydrolase (beta-lactamase superfamily II)
LLPFPIQVTPGVYLLGALQPAAAYVVETPEGLVLVDSGLDSDASQLKSQMANLRLDWRGIRAILLTHAHIDHSGGAEHLRENTGAKIYAGQGEAGVLRAGGPREAFFSAFSLPGGALHQTKIDVELKGGESIAFGDVRFRALATPGHTSGSICYLMERKELRALFSGDVISMLAGDERFHIRTWKPLGTYAAYLPPRYRGDARAYLSSLRALRALPAPDLVLPGHPRGDPSPQDPRIAPERYAAILDDGISEMTTLVARYEADGPDFLDGNPKRLLPDLYYLGNLRGRAVYGFFAASRFILVDAPGPGLVDFLNTALEKLGLKPAKPDAVLITACGEEETAGLKKLLEECRAQVFVAAAGVARIRALCPAGTVIHAAEDLPGLGWFQGASVPLWVRGLAQAAYRIPWAGKTVLFSGRIPILLRQETDALLFSTLSKSRDDTLDYLISVNLLAEPAPDLWLPAVAVDGQNADLYDHEWQQIIADNYRVGYRSLNLRR